jgi:hypothetical protein
VDQALDPLGDLDEGAEGDQLRYAALDLLPDLDPLDDLLPGVLARLLEAERDPLAVAVDFQDLDLDLSSRQPLPVFSARTARPVKNRVVFRLVAAAALAMTRA